ncbi:MAG: FAD-binding oxidoreductase [Burkholderiales bacterium]|nr:FAD-binding oxidoreductase [Burkholderiales bacterium]
MTNSLFIPQLIAIVGTNNIIVDNEARKPFEKEWRGKFCAASLAVVFPQTLEQIQHLIKLCSNFKIHIVPQGGNTSLCAAAIPEISNQNQEIILNLSKLNKIIKLDKLNHTIEVEAGCTLQQIQSFANANNLYFPLSIGSEGSCQIGGNIATNAGGIHVVKYGMMRQLVLGLEVVLADGSVLQQQQELYKNNSYLDLKQLFIGSEGTLGIITKAVLKLYPQPNNYICGLIACNSINKAIEVFNLLTQQYDLHAFEIINKYTQNIYNCSFSNNPFALTAEWLILFELIDNLNDNLDAFAQSLTQFNLDLNNVILASNEKERKNLWQQRENIPLAEKYASCAEIFLRYNKTAES